MRFTVIAFLYATENGLVGIQKFEKKVLPLLKQHNGRLDHAFTPAPELSIMDDAPDEVHVLSFPSEAAFTAYRKDPQHLALRDERTKAIRKTRIIAGTAMTSYAPSGAETDAHR